MARGKKENDLAVQDKNKKIKWNDQDFQVNGNAKEAMETLSTHLKDSKKGGLFGGFRKNSDYFNNVERGLEDVLRELDGTFTGNMQEDIPVMEQIANAYDRLIEACEAYNNRNAHTGKGKTRQGIVGKILERAQSDHAKLAEYFGKMSAIPVDERAKTPIEALEKARRRTVELPEEHKILGAAASEVIRFKEGDSDKHVYFKKDEIYQRKGLQQKILDAMAQVQSNRKYAISETVYEESVKEIIENEYNNIDSFFKHPKYFDDRKYHEFWTSVDKKIGAMSTMDEFIPNKHLLNIKDKNINITKRNVAASRFADLLGVGDLIAHSESVTLRSEDGFEREGILMEEAGKMEGKEARRQLVNKFSQQKEEGSEEDFDMMKYMKQAISPEFQRSLADLQVLDALMGQADRHASNYMTDIKDGKLGAVKGIDNDFSFGNTTLKGDEVWLPGIGEIKGVIGKQGRSPVNEEGEMVIPYMSEQLKEGILSVTKGQLEFIFKDVLEPETIESCWKRVWVMQLAILMDLKKFETEGGTYRYLKNDEWNSETLETFFSQDRQNYFSSHINKSELEKDEQEMRILETAKAFWNEQKKEINLANPDTVYQFVNIMTKDAEKDKLGYLKKCGILEEWCSKGTEEVFANLPFGIKKLICQNSTKPEIIDKLSSIPD